MTQDKTLREQLKDNFTRTLRTKEEYRDDIMASADDVADFYEDKIKSVVREIQELARKNPMYNGDRQDLRYNEGFEQFGDDLLERLGIK